MADPIAWYMIELSRCLTPHLNHGKVIEILKESETHLNCETQRLSNELGLDSVKAGWLAIESFGAPEKVASAFIRQSGRSVFGMRPLPVLVVSMTVALFCWVFHWQTLSGYYDNFGATWQNGLAGVVGVTALFFFGLACRAAYGPQRGRIALIGAGFIVASLVFVNTMLISQSNFRQGISRFHLARDLAKIEKTSAQLSALNGYVDRGQAAFAAATKPEDIPLAYKDYAAATAAMNLPPDEYRSVLGAYSTPDGGFLTPNTFVYAMVDGRIWGLRFVSTFKEAKDQWKENVPHAKDGIRRAIDEMNSLANLGMQAQNGRLLFMNGFLTIELLFTSLAFIPVFFVIDAIVWALLKRRQAKPGLAIA